MNTDAEEKIERAGRVLIAAASAPAKVILFGSPQALNANLAAHDRTKSNISFALVGATPPDKDPVVSDEHLRLGCHRRPSPFAAPANKTLQA